ncbi:MAG: hypothetical protein ACHP7K_07240 [Actinomycetales bacterium]
MYLLVILGVGALLVWALVLTIMFLRLRISELRRSAGTGGPPA